MTKAENRLPNPSVNRWKAIVASMSLAVVLGLFTLIQRACRGPMLRLSDRMNHRRLNAPAERRAAHFWA
jgi:hypothetical protein